MNPPKPWSNSLLFILIVISGLSRAETDSTWEQSFAGHSKYRFLAAHYPEHSLYRTLYDANSQDHLWDNRFKWDLSRGRWDINVDYQLQVVDSERLGGAININQAQAAGTGDDDHRIMDLTHILSSDDNTVVSHRLDRFNVGYTGDQTVLRLGRQVLSWGNGLMFNPMDFFNPFDPTALDREYKTGDDMLYGQYLFDSGDDVQAVWVGRRNDDGHVDEDEHSVAAKYHTWLIDQTSVAGLELSGVELDLLVAEHFRDTIAGVGLASSIGGAVWRGDVMVTHTDSGNDNVFSFVTNLSYSWVWGDTNYSGMIEYFYNGFGLDNDNYTLPALQSDPALQERLNRGELYTLGRHYLAASAQIELSPLWLANPAVFMNLEDQSALLQLATNYDLGQNWRAIAALNIPLGPKNTEYGGIKTGIGQTSLATSGGLFAQIAYYF